MTLLLLAAMLFAPVAQKQSAVRTLASFRDVARPLLVFAPRKGDPRLAKQIQLLAGAPGLGERQVPVLLCVFETEAGKPVDSLLARGEQQRAREAYGIGPGDFTVILLGKDGGEKQRWTEPVTSQTLFQIIDAMPMRQDEMKHSSGRD